MQAMGTSICSLLSKVSAFINFCLSAFLQHTVFPFDCLLVFYCCWTSHTKLKYSSFSNTVDDYYVTLWLYFKLELCILGLYAQTMAPSVGHLMHELTCIKWHLMQQLSMLMFSCHGSSINSWFLSKCFLHNSLYHDLVYGWKVARSFLDI